MKRKFFFLVLALPLLTSAPAYAEEQDAAHQTCVDVKVGSAQSYSCLNQRLGAIAHQQPRFSSDGNAPYSANSPGNVTGQFNESATRNRLGANFGKSVIPERPAYNPPPAFPHH